jgi:WD40 repeat protein
VVTIYNQNGIAIRQWNLPKDQKFFQFCSEFEMFVSRGNSERGFTVWDFSGNTLLEDSEIPFHYFNTKSSENQNYIAINVTESKKIVLLDIGQRKLINISYPDNVEDFGYFITNQREVILSYPGKIYFLDKNGFSQKEIKLNTDSYFSIKAHCYQRQILVFTMEENFYVLDILAKKSTMLAHYTELNSRFIFTKDEQHLVTSTKDGIVHIWDISSIQNPFVKSKFKSNGSWDCYPKEFMVNETLLLVRTISNNQIWDWKKTKLVLTFVLLRGESAIAYTPDGFYEIFDEEALNYFDFRSKEYESGFLPEEEKLKFHKPGLLRSIYEEYSQN